MTATMGVATIEYLPFAFLCLLSPVTAIIYGFFDIKIERLEYIEFDDEEKATRLEDTKVKTHVEQII